MRRALYRLCLSSVVGCAFGACCAESGRRSLDLPGRTDSRPYHHVVQSGDTVYVAGTIGRSADTGLPPEDAADEARLALEGVQAKLALAGLTMDDLVSVQVYCSDLSLYETFNDVYATFFVREYPVRAFIGSGPLLFGGRFEISAIGARR
ncbi:MAG: RidA family protein [Planctomycetota bacterium]